ncbi:hypothetical protein P3S67_013109 [Capsicum chacoense]
MFSKARRKGRSRWLGSDYWDKLIVYWASLKFQKKSAQTKASRNSKKGNLLHTSGSVSMGTTKWKLEASLTRSALVNRGGLQGMGSSVTMSNEQLEEMQQEVRELARKYEKERKIRMEEESRRATLGSDVKELKTQVNTLMKLFCSLQPSSDDDGEEDEED